VIVPVRHGASQRAIRVFTSPMIRSSTPSAHREGQPQYTCEAPASRPPSTSCLSVHR